MTKLACTVPVRRPRGPGGVPWSAARCCHQGQQKELPNGVPRLQDAMERRLRKLEQAMTSPLGSPVRSRMLGGPMNPLDGGLSMLGGQPSSGLMGGGFPYAYGAAPVMIIPPASPSARMAGALAQMDWQANAMGGGGGYGAVNPQQPGYFTPQGPNGAMPPHMPYTPGQQHHRGYGPPSPGYGYADAYRDQRSSTSAEPSTPYSGYGNVPHPEMSSADRFQRSLQSSTAAVPAEPDWSLEQIHRVPQVPRNTNPNQMHEEALRAARIQYHDEKKRMMELQLARQRQAAAS